MFFANNYTILSASEHQSAELEYKDTKNIAYLQIQVEQLCRKKHKFAHIYAK